MKITKAHRICYVLSLFPHGLSRVEIMRCVHMLEGKTTRFARDTHLDYFRPGPRGHRGFPIEGSGDGWLSPRARGMFEVARKCQNTFIYKNTALGNKVAQEYVKSFQNL